MRETEPRRRSVGQHRLRRDRILLVIPSETEPEKDAGIDRGGKA